MQMPRRLLVTTTALGALVALPFAAQAADMMPLKAPIMAPAFNWTGFYFGGNGGCATANTPTPNNFGADPTETDIFAFNKEDMSGCFSGFQAGYNWQTGNW